MKTKTNTLRGLALAGAIAMISAEQSAEAVMIFDLIDADSFTLTADSTTLNDSFTYTWGATSGFENTGTFSGHSNQDSPVAIVYTSGGVLEGVSLREGPFSGGVTLADGGVITVSGITTVDLTTLTLPSAASPLALVEGSATGADNSVVPEPSSAGLLALAGCALMLRRKRK